MNNIDPFRNYGTPKEVEESKMQRNLPESTKKQLPLVECRKTAAAITETAAVAAAAKAATLIIVAAAPSPSSASKTDESTPPIVAAAPSLSSASKTDTSTLFAMEFPVPTYTAKQLLSKKTEWLNHMNLFDTNKDMSHLDFDRLVRLINNIRFANGGDDTFSLCLCNMFEYNCNSCMNTNSKTYKNDRVFEPATFLVPRTSLSDTKTNCSRY